MREIKIDVKNEIVGRIASKIAVILQGKDLPSYSPRLIGNTRVVVSNISKIKFSGKKMEDKIYYHHTGYIGNLKKKTAGEIFENNPSEILKKAVMGMLPKNKLRAKRIKNLIVL